jgi:transposase
VDRSKAGAVYDAGREAVVEVLLAMDRRIRQLEARVEKLERQLAKSSRNSSLPPSSDPPGTSRPRRGKDRSGRPQGAQPGHEGHGRELLPAAAVDEVIEHWPQRCQCGHVFCTSDRVAVREPGRHQLEELPELAVRVIEHRSRRVRCPDCGIERGGELPAEVLQSAFGPRLQAAVACLSVRNRVSRRDAVECCEELFGARISAGAIDAILTRAGDALAEPHERLLHHVRTARALNVDETGWRLKGSRRTLWGAFTHNSATFHIAPDRHEDRLRELLAGHEGIVTSDRWWAYDHLALSRRQICWAHLRRDFAAHAEELAAEKEFGDLGLQLCEQIFWAWEVFSHTRERRELKRTMRQLRRAYEPIIRRYAAKTARNKRCRGMARNLLKVWPALWTFASQAGVEPTNNHAERALRGAVIYRKLSLGRPVRGWRAPHRAAALGLGDLPATASFAVRLPQRAIHRSGPR